MWGILFFTRHCRSFIRLSDSQKYIYRLSTFLFVSFQVTFCNIFPLTNNTKNILSGCAVCSREDKFVSIVEMLVTVFTYQYTRVTMFHVIVFPVECHVTFLTRKLNITVYGLFMSFQIILPCKTFEAHIALELHREHVDFDLLVLLIYYCVIVSLLLLVVMQIVFRLAVYLIYSSINRSYRPILA